MGAPGARKLREVPGLSDKDSNTYNELKTQSWKLPP
jgi:hypothetical protein